MSMKWFLRIVVIVAVLVIGALGWQWLAADPGVVQLRIRGYVIETTVITAVGLVALLFAAIWLVWWLLRAPLRWLAGRRRARSRHAFAQAELRLREGQWAKAEKLFVRAAEDSDFRIPALLEAAQAAHTRGNEAQAHAYLAALDDDAEGHRLVQLERAREALANEQPAHALSLLEGLSPLPPNGLLLRHEALRQSRRAEEALALLPELHRCQLLDGLAYAKLELATILQALAEASDGAQLTRVWEALPRGQKRTDSVVSAYVQRAVELADVDASALIETQLKLEWSEDLIRQYGRIRQSSPARRLKQAEAWLSGHKDSVGLNLTLARLHLALGETSQAEEFVGHALALDSDAEAWELMADIAERQNQSERARVALGNVLRSRRGEAPLPLPAGGARASHLGLFAASEKRGEHGFPQLPDDVAAH
ncbi:HemY protein [Pseudofulvimonas gallinarii]|uniref:HemY protein n=2 Tax=Pseudofulvimonas gallinarii TaxID=634155 RepID=A0A4R3L861_9GAMM|nr:HemY protein [Pseudofulvimonas gallinarii]